MNCTQAQERFAELLDHHPGVTPSPEVRAHLANCPDCQREFASLQRTLTALDSLPSATPSPQLRTHFYAMLEEEKHSAASVRWAERRRHRVNLWRWILSPVAACALLAIGFLVGQRSRPEPNPAADDTHRQIAELQRKVDSMGQIVGYTLLHQQPASERLKGILAAQDIKSPNSQVITQLISALALDPSTNVRLTALESLYPHADQDVVRAGVLAALGREQNPLVQVAMIDFLVAAHDSEAAGTFENLANKDQIDRSVREAARRALAQL